MLLRVPPLFSTRCRYRRVHYDTVAVFTREAAVPEIVFTKEARFQTIEEGLQARYASNEDTQHLHKLGRDVQGL